MVNYALKDAAFGAFVLFYYKQVLGLSGTLTGLAIGLSMIWDALSDPMVGAWSDRLHSRWGRRHPLMLAAVIPMALAFVLLFSPPDWARLSQLALFSWLLATVILLRTALTLFMVPYLALGAEISTDYHERTRLASARTNLGWFVGVLVPSTSLLLLFPAQAGTDGRFVSANYQYYGWLCALGVIIFSATCIRGTAHFIPLLPQRAQRGSSMLRDTLDTFKNRNFRYLVLLETAVGGLGGIVGALLMVTYTYFWQLDTVQISLLFAGPPVLAVLLLTTSSDWLNRRLEKQRWVQLACLAGGINLMWLTPLQLLGYLPADSALVFALIFVNYAIHVTCTIARTIANHALLADIADEHDLQSGQRQEGVMFAAVFFAAKFISGFGYLVAGPYLDFIGLEPGMLPGQTPASVDWGLGIIMGPGLALIMIFPVWAAFKLRVSRAGHAHIREQLARRVLPRQDSPTQ